MFQQLWNDEAGFIIRAELVLVATLLVIGLIDSLSEVQHAIVSELNDVADAIGELNQCDSFSGFHKRDFHSVHAVTYGSDFEDQRDDCDNNQCQIACDAPANQTPKFGGRESSQSVLNIAEGLGSAAPAPRGISGLVSELARRVD